MQDELKPKSDLLEKLPGFFDAAQKEVAQYYPIWREKRYSETDERTLPADCWEPWTIQGDGFLWFWDQDANLTACGCFHAEVQGLAGNHHSGHPGQPGAGNPGGGRAGGDLSGGGHVPANGI